MVHEVLLHRLGALLAQLERLKAKLAADDRAAQMVGFDLEEDGSLTPDPTAFWSIATTARDNVLATFQQAIAEDWTPQQLEAVLQASVVWTPEFR